MTKISGLVLAACLIFPASAQAATLLSFDLSVTNQITVNAEPGLSDISISGPDFTGIYIANFFSAPGTGFSIGGSTGNFTTANDTADNSPRLWRGNATETGLNIYSFATGTTASVTAGARAFSGSATWNVSAATYNDLLNGSPTGSIFFPADTADDIVGATAIGEYTVTPVPLPAPVLMLGSLLVGFGLFGRRKTPDGLAASPA